MSNYIALRGKNGGNAKKCGLTMFQEALRGGSKVYIFAITRTRGKRGAGLNLQRERGGIPN